MVFEVGKFDMWSYHKSSIHLKSSKVVELFFETSEIDSDGPGGQVTGSGYDCKLVKDGDI